MATIEIPSPTAFLQSPVIQPTSPLTLSVKATPRKRPSRPKTQKKQAPNDNTPPKPKQTKSRDGCKNCKEKRLKCDETKPHCIQCHKKGVTCKGYEKILKWRQTFQSAPAPPKQRRRSSASKNPGSRPASPAPSEHDDHPIADDTSPLPPAYQPPIDPAAPLIPQLPQHHSSFEAQSGLSDSPSYLPTPYPLQPVSFSTQDSFASSTPSLINDGFEEDATSQSARTLDSSIWSSQSPQLADLLLPGTEVNAPPLDHVKFQPTLSGIPYQPPDLLPALRSYTSNSEDDVEEIVREDIHDKSWMVPLESPTYSGLSASTVGSWANALPVPVLGQPKLHADSEEMLMMRFDTQTCGILSIKNGPTENPWRTILWPLAREENALRHAINSLTAFHASKEKPRLRVKGMEHMDQSLQLLSHGIESMQIETALATTLVLAFCESWDILIQTGIAHLRGGRKLVLQALANYKQGTIPPDNERKLGFLCRTWVYMDVIARLTSLESDDSEDFDVVLTPLCQPSALSREVDPLMGCASTMFPIIGRVANLIRRVRRSSSNSLKMISQANELKSSLEQWQAPTMFQIPEDKTTDLEQGLRTAEAYRGATLLYLYQAIPEISFEPVTEKIFALAQDVLRNLANVKDTSGAVIIHIFPLLAASCEAVTDDDRGFVGERWQSMMSRMNIRNLDKCWEVVKEVWDRRDSDKAEKYRQKQRIVASRIQMGYRPTPIMKRKYSNAIDDDVDGAHRFELGVETKRRAIPSLMEASSENITKPITLRRASTTSCSFGGLEYDMTVRGRAHWAGVMKDWKWEVLLG